MLISIPPRTEIERQYFFLIETLLLDRLNSLISLIIAVFYVPKKTQKNSVFQEIQARTKRISEWFSESCNLAWDLVDI